MNGRLLFQGGLIALAALITAFRIFHVPLPRLAPIDPPKPSLAFTVSASPKAHARMKDEGSVVVIYVAGEVLHPGVYRLAATERVEGAVRAAGGLTQRADRVAVNLAKRLEDGEEIAVPQLGEASGDRGGSAHSASRHARHGKHARSSRTRKLPSRIVELNVADDEQLQFLPGIGPGLAARILAYRRLNGPFASIDDLRDVGGMTARKIDQLSPYVNLDQR